MALIECTQKLLLEIQEDKSDAIVASQPSLLGNWHAHVMLFSRRKCVLFTNDTTLYSIFVSKLLKKDFQNLRTIFLDALALNLKNEHLEGHIDRVLAGYHHELQFTKTHNKRVIGTMNNMHRFIKHCVDADGGIEHVDCLELSKYINRIPFTPINYCYPIERLRKQLGELDVKTHHA